MTEPNVWRQWYYFDRPFEAWVKKNEQKLLQIRPELLDYGLWMIKSTYSTRSCALNAWMDKGRSLYVGFQATTVIGGEVAPSGTWYKSSSDGD